jgi:hypothetical protein
MLAIVARMIRARGCIVNYVKAAMLPSRRACAGVLFSQNKSGTGNQPVVLFSQNKSTPVISRKKSPSLVSCLIKAMVALEIHGALDARTVCM